MAAPQFFIFRDGRVLARRNAQEIVPFANAEWQRFKRWTKHILPVGRRPDDNGRVVELTGDFETPEDLEWIPLRSLLGRVDDPSFNLWGRASQLLNWEKTHRFCGQCGLETVDHASEQAKVCPACSLTWYPRISPCIIVLVTRGEDLLLARSPRFTAGVYSTLAGFIEPGESVESTIKREIIEEVAISVKNLDYFGSQPWPFPGQLMLGFFAEYESGEIMIDGREISDARWYHFRDLPQIPGEGTIAGQMIRFHTDRLNGTFQ